MRADEDLVDEGVEERLERACRATVGDTLRSITYFTPGAYEQIYLRPDLEDDADLAGFVEHETDGFRANRAYRDSELGDYCYTVRTFENGYMTRVTASEAGVFLTTDALTIHRAEDVAEAVSEVIP